MKGIRVLLKLLRRAAAFLSLPMLASGALAQPAQAAATPRPALWEVSDPDTKIYLFGTIHLLPRKFSWRTQALDRAIASSDTLVVETIVDVKNPAEMARELRRLGYADNLPPLATRIDPKMRTKLEAAIAKTGIPRPVFDRMRTWAAAFTLLGVQFKEGGVEAEEGVEHKLRTAFNAAGKPVGELESNADQLNFFHGLPEKAQRALLESAVEPSTTAKGEFRRMVQIWSRGDVDAIGEAFNDQLAGSPELMDALIRRRNQAWTAWIQRRLATPGTVLFAVGAGHLAGRHSVQTMLERQGYKVRRLQ